MCRLGSRCRLLHWKAAACGSYQAATHVASSTIALNGRGDVVETPGGWQDFLHQNPGYFRAVGVTTSSVAPKPAPVKVEAPKATKLSYKDQRRLQELEAALAALPDKIAKLEVDLADPGLYARDRAAFDRINVQLEKTRRELSASEEEWLALEERREALETGR